MDRPRRAWDARAAFDMFRSAWMPTERARCWSCSLLLIGFFPGPVSLGLWSSSCARFRPAMRVVPAEIVPRGVSLGGCVRERAGRAG